MTQRYGQCTVVGCDRDATYDYESRSYFSTCDRCAGWRGLSSGFVHLHAYPLADGTVPETPNTAVSMGLVAFNVTDHTMTFSCSGGTCHYTETVDMDDMLTRYIEAVNAAAYRLFAGTYA